MEKYICAWRDEESVYVNEAGTLAEIVEDVIEYYSNEEGVVVIKTQADSLKVLVEFDEIKLDSVIDLDASIVSKFLCDVAKKFNREDQFDIKKVVKQKSLLNDLFRVDKT
jgi:CobQ-like glutamine amidotransferase family enzyme